MLIDADCISDGDMLTCPVHKDNVVYVFGTDWWRLNGGSFEINAVVKIWAPCCMKYYTLNTWSYRG